MIPSNCAALKPAADLTLISFSTAIEDVRRRAAMDEIGFWKLVIPSQLVSEAMKITFAFPDLVMEISTTYGPDEWSVHRLWLANGEMALTGIWSPGV
jgi:hypothetical protein